MKKDTPKRTILIVDDIPENIDILSELLRTDYNIKIATSGEKGIDIATSQDIDLILLDIIMPTLYGYEVCRQLKSQEKTKGIPIIFVTSKSEITDEAKGFEVGAVDYITKPYNPMIVKSRVKTHIELKETREDLQNMLQKTLLGSLKVLTDILALLNPTTFSRASKLRTYAKQIVAYLHLKNPWQYELAAMLSQIGTIALPDEILKKLHKGRTLTKKERKIYERGSKIGHKILANIPRLEAVAEMIKKMHEPYGKSLDSLELEKRNPVSIGSQLLKILIDFDLLLIRGNSHETAFKQMYKNLNDYDPILLEAFEKVLELKELDMDVRLLCINEFEEGIILDENVYTHDDLLVVKKGAEVTYPLLKKLQQFSEMSEIDEPIRVLIPQ